MNPRDPYSKDGRTEAGPAMTEPLWTVEDVAKYLRLREETVRLMARARRIPAIKVGKVWRFRAREIREMLKSRTATA